jgi:peptidoglycan/xylan/chitin deacetylase (PgdA/CDA1 family)
MKVPGLKTAVKIAHWVRSRFVRSAVILGYHRVMETASDPFHLCASPASFESQLKLLSEVARPIRLQDLLAGLQKKCIPDRGIVISFDDGYADVFYHALPLLEKYKIPATVFITTGRLGQEFWWDELQRIILESKNIPGGLSLLVNSHEYRWRTHSFNRKASSDPKNHLLRSLHQWMQFLSEQERENVLCQLKEWFDVKLSIPSSPLKRALTADELVSLSRHDLIEIGSHSVSHVSLPLVPMEMQRQEVVHSKMTLETLLGKQINAFSYPAGTHSPGVKAILCSAGFNSACISASDVVWNGSDPFELPRFWLQHYNRDQLTRWLRTWLVRA